MSSLKAEGGVLLLRHTFSTDILLLDLLYEVRTAREEVGKKNPSKTHAQYYRDYTLSSPDKLSRVAR